MNWEFIFLGFGSFLSSFVITKILVKLLTNMQIIDVPDHRRAHAKSTPRGAGIALVVIFVTFFPLFEFHSTGALGYTQFLLQILLPLALVSLWDDIIGVKILFRLLIHITCSLLAILWFINPSDILHDHLPLIAELCIGAIALAGFANIYNFMDGIDGISAIESIHLAINMLLLCYLRADIIVNIGFISSTSIIILGWAVGFLVFNWHPAKIFLGDVGSITLGFLLGLCLLMIASSSAHLFVSSLIAALYYIADGGLTLIIRIIKREKIWEPHLNHFFQKAVRRGMSHSEVVKKVAKCNVLLMIFSINALYYPVLSTILATLTVVYTLVTFA